MFDLSNDVSVINAKDKLKRFIYAKKIVEIKEVKKTRTGLQNSALHLFYTQLASQMSELGMTFHYTGLKGSDFELPWTAELVKNFIWRPIQKTLFNVESTTKINTKQINEILDILVKHFGNMGVPVSFPSKFNKYLEQIGKN